MESLVDHVTLSRLQFALTAHFHILWPVLSIGLSLFLVVMEALWLKTGNIVYYRHCRFWSRLFLVNFTVGVVSGIPMEFQFGTNWAPFSVAGGDFFGHMLGFEAAMAFMLEATFLGIMAFGWNRVSPRVHFFSTCMVALGSSLSAFWIMVANSWMHTPTGGVFIDGRFVITDKLAAIFNPDMPWGVSHMWLACIEISVFVVGGLSAWYILKGRHVDFFLKSFKIAVIAAIVVTPLQILVGDGSGTAVYEHQPAKLAAIEAHWETNPPGEGAPWKIIAWPNKARQDNDWAIEIPYALSLITTKSPTGPVRGLREFPVEDQPPVLLPFYAFRIMMAVGFLLFFLMLWTAWTWYRGGLDADRIMDRKRLLHAWIAAVPLSYIGMETGWITREVGRQPWILYNMLRTTDAATNMPASAVGGSLLTFAVLYPLLFVLFVYFAKRIIAAGPAEAVPPRQRLQGHRHE
ncbi:MAG: cytochrome ubiquinol oxidase subunit I [Syntrophobacteraceae bacterium]|nr:cytochrome ubiquinol oxidase subunit I [Syntrophobacteraceae bacterium]